MKIYTSFNSIPELSDFPKEKRELIWRKYYVKCLLSWKALLALFLFILLQLAIGELRFFLKAIFSDIHWRYIDYPLITIGWLVGFLIVFQVLVAVMRPLIANDKATQEEN